MLDDRQGCSCDQWGNRTETFCCHMFVPSEVVTQQCPSAPNTLQSACYFWKECWVLKPKSDDELEKTTIRFKIRAVLCASLTESGLAFSNRKSLFPMRLTLKKLKKRKKNNFMPYSSARQELLWDAGEITSLGMYTFYIPQESVRIVWVYTW